VTSGFQYIAFFVALVYQLVRLIPEGHPYTDTNNIGRFSIRHVIAEAANHLTFNLKNVDQIILFCLILIGMIIGLIQLAALLISISFAPAIAAIPSFTELFVAKNPTQDIAFMFMDLVFGMPGIFDSCIATGAKCTTLNGSAVGEGAKHIFGGSYLGGINDGNTIPFPIHVGLHNMLQIYSYGLLVIAAFITIYFIFVVLAETAQSGTPFGKRFNKVWAPIRIVVAFGLLIPIGAQGLNSSQYLVLYAAKFGSAFASNGWLIFNNTLTSSYLGEVDNLIATANPPEVGSLMQFLFVAKTCAEYYKLNDEIDIHPYLVRTPASATPNLLINAGTTYDELLAFANGESKVTMRFGVENSKDYALYKGFVKPLCGEMQFTLSDGRIYSTVNGTKIMEEAYFSAFTSSYFVWFADNFPLVYVKKYSPKHNKTDLHLPGKNFYTNFLNHYQEKLNNALKEAVEAEKSSGRWQENIEGLKERGWGGGAIWYNRIAEMNGALTTAILNVPVPTLYPAVMENVKDIKIQTDKNISTSNRFDPKLANGQEVKGMNADDKTQANILYQAFQDWQDSGMQLSSHTAPTGNIIIDIINGIFGTQGLFDMRANAKSHPLAQLSTIGRSLIEAAIQNIGLAIIGGISGVLVGSLSSFIGAAAGVAAGFLISIATIAMSIGFVLFYVLPFLPFVYFFFAVTGWIKGIFEAMVGAPLWALAHIRIDGNGLAGQAAATGYFLIFEVFLRPILITFGLLASTSIFSAMVLMLNEIFELVVANLTGFSGVGKKDGTISMEMFRGPLDEFMFTVVYAVIVYLMGMSSFKLIDNIPNNILRWMGQNISTFNDSREDPAQSLMGTAWIGGERTFSSLGGGLSGIANMRK